MNGGVSDGRHFSCSLTAVLLARVHAYGCGAAGAELLREAGSSRSVEYLTHIGNSVLFDEAIALCAAARSDPELPARSGRTPPSA
jgi:hypothetical protein